MIPTFVISLSDYEDRRRSIASHLNQLGISFEFWDAVDGRNGLPTMYERQIDRQAAKKAGRALSDTEYACALSHITLYRRIVADRIPYALIFEDDALPLPSLLDFLAGKHWGGADIIQLWTRRRTFVRRRGARKLFADHVSYLAAPRMKSPSTVAYTVSLSAARTIVDEALPVDKEADWPSCVDDLIKKRQFRCIYPPLVCHQSVEGYCESSIVSASSSIGNKDKRRFLGVYIPSFRKMLQSYRRAPLKLLCKRLP
ncbi:MAG: glycosyltransferase family 25 protein [Aestuariivita sp.]|nr:glycosyltransferase family 25 protein [Aestuariivita sp.]